MSRFALKDKVVVFPKHKYDREYIPEANERRHKHHTKIGIITETSNSHGECYLVKFAKNQEAWYEPDEIVLVQETANMQFTPYAWASDPTALKVLEEYGFEHNVRCKGDIWGAAQSLFSAGVNVMIKHGKEGDMLYVDSRGFSCR